MRHWQPVRCLKRSALTTARKSMSVGRPPFGDVTVTHGALAAQCASVRWSHPASDRVGAHIPAYAPSPHQNAMFSIDTTNPGF